MAIEPKYVVLLIEELSKQSGTSTDHKGFAKMSELIPNGAKKSDKTGLFISHRYLYDVYRKALKNSQINNAGCRFYESYLDLIAIAIKKKNFKDFVESLKNKIDPQIRNYVGTWWSVVRSNSGNYLLKAPVIIYEDENIGVGIRLLGNEHDFKGNVHLRVGSLFCELDSLTDKKLYIILKATTNRKSNVLQGTFTGISSTGDPIAGREIFVRATQQFEAMRWSKISIKSKELSPAIMSYFRIAKDNCLKIDNKIDLEE